MKSIFAVVFALAAVQVAVATTGIKITMCYVPNINNFTFLTCTKNCTDFIVNEGQCFPKFGEYITLSCDKTPKQCFHFSGYNSSNCDPSTEMTTGVSLCDDCQYKSIDKCGPTSVKSLQCSDDQCSTNCTTQIVAPLKKCVSIPDKDKNVTESVVVSHYSPCKKVTYSRYFSQGCSGSPSGTTDYVSGSCSDLTWENGNYYTASFTCVDQGVSHEESSRAMGLLSARFQGTRTRLSRL